MSHASTGRCVPQFNACIVRPGTTGFRFIAASNSDAKGVLSATTVQRYGNIRVRPFIKEFG